MREQREGGPGGYIPGKWARLSGALTSWNYITQAESWISDMGTLTVSFELDPDQFNPENRDAVIAEIRRRLDATGVSDVG